MNVKYILLPIVAAVISVSASAQSLKELLEGKATYIQDPVVEKEDSTVAVKAPAVKHDLVYMAVSPALKIVKQQYKLMKDGEYYGGDNKPYFGETFTLAAKVAGATILQNEVVFPWKNDGNYQGVYSDTYSPVYHKTYVKSLDAGEYETKDFELGTPYVKEVGTDSLLYVHSDVYSDFGLTVDATPGVKDGYMLWVYQDGENCTHNVEPMSVTTSGSETVLPLTPSEPESLIGGVYVIPVQDRPGTISFHLVGMASSADGKNWALKLLTKEETTITE